MACSGSSHATSATKSPVPDVQRGGHDALGAFGQDLAQVADGPRGEAAGDDAAHPGVLRAGPC